MILQGLPNAAGETTGVSTGYRLPAGRSTIRFALTDLVPGEYTLYVMVDSSGDGQFTQGADWYGAYGAEQRAGVADTFRVEAEPRCDVSFSVANSYDHGTCRLGVSSHVRGGARCPRRRQ